MFNSLYVIILKSTFSRLDLSIARESKRRKSISKNGSSDAGHQRTQQQCLTIVIGRVQWYLQAPNKVRINARLRRGEGVHR